MICSVPRYIWLGVVINIFFPSANTLRTYYMLGIILRSLHSQTSINCAKGYDEKEIDWL